MICTDAERVSRACYSFWPRLDRDDNRKLVKKPSTRSNSTYGSRMRTRRRCLVGTKKKARRCARHSVPTSAEYEKTDQSKGAGPGQKIISPSLIGTRHRQCESRARGADAFGLRFRISFVGHGGGIVMRREVGMVGVEPRSKRLQEGDRIRLVSVALCGSRSSRAQTIRRRQRCAMLALCAKTATPSAWRNGASWVLMKPCSTQAPQRIRQM